MSLAEMVGKRQDVSMKVGSFGGTHQGLIRYNIN